MDEQDKEPIEPKEPIKEGLRKIDEALDQYEKSLGVPVLESTYESSLEKYISMPHQHKEKLTMQQCAEIAVECNILAYHITRSFNREKARHTWCENKIKKIISSTCHQFPGSWDRQEMQAIAQDSAATKLDNIRNWCQQRMDKLNFLANQLKNVGDSFGNLQKAKLSKNG